MASVRAGAASVCGRRGEAGGHGDQVPAQGGTARNGVLGAGERPSRAQQVVGDHRAGQPGAVGSEQPRRDAREPPMDQIGEGGLHDRVFFWVRSASAVGRSELVTKGW